MRNKFRLILGMSSVLLMMPFSSCSLKKALDAPTIEKIYQDVDGNVLCQHSVLTSSVDPQFSFDGKEWFGTQLNDISNKRLHKLLSYDSIEEKFCTNTLDNKFEHGSYTFYLREGEDANNQASKASTGVELKVKKPNLSTVVITNEKQLDNSSVSVTNNYLSDNEKTNKKDCIIYSPATEKYTFATSSYINIVPSSTPGNYNYDIKYESSSRLFPSLEYCFIKSSNYTSRDINSEVNQDAFEGKLTFKTCTQGLELPSANLLETNSLTGEKYAKLVLRYKAGDDTLASKCSLVDLYKYQKTFNVSIKGDSIPTVTEKRYDPTLDTMFIKCESPFSYSTVKSCFSLFYLTNYPASGNVTCDSFEIKVFNNNDTEEVVDGEGNVNNGAFIHFFYKNEEVKSFKFNYSYMT